MTQLTQNVKQGFVIASKSDLIGFNMAAIRIKTLFTINFEPSDPPLFCQDFVCKM